MFVAGDKLYAYNAATALWDVTDHIDEFLLRDVSEDLSMILGVTSVWSTEGDLTRLCDAADVAAIALFARSYLRDEARALLIDRLAHLTVMAGGLVHDTRKGITRQRTREDYFTSES